MLHIFGILPLIERFKVQNDPNLFFLFFARIVNFFPYTFINKLLNLKLCNYNIFNMIRYFLLFDYLDFRQQLK